ncbi:tetratricopeptide repeat protein [Undibacterium cyanobacteriorum]|uniref:Tetratricopeptide repeat protein n=1 Tax=Undibacterium cyanobacteriorum TaxID=3073561 RepID=A0ABY9RG63_9BURK|nr:tetratricopeptide repeat protein [Undibacterium sp. 20NA77.5]WMW79843.1 tetratricopeptide repeat protein [Undibacterium sp. 20NA77.5]
MLKKTTLIATIITLSFSQLAEAHEFDSLLKARKYVEAEKAANARLQASPNHPDALAAKTELILIEGKESRLDEALKLAEQCINANPKFSECYELHGNINGLKAQRASVFTAMSYANKFKDSIRKAMELDPNNFGARFSMLQFYIQAPKVVGGGKKNAEEFIADTSKTNPVAATLFQAQLDIANDNLAKAQSIALSVNTANIEGLNRIHRSVLTSLGHSFINNKKYSEADKVFTDANLRYPDFPLGNFGLGKSLQEQGKQKEAIAYFEKAIAIEASAAAYFRLAKAQQSLGEKAKAISNFEKALNSQPGLPKASKSEAEEQLKTLKS